MNSKVMMMNNHKHEARNIVNRVRVRVPPKQSSFSSSLTNHCHRLNRVHDCCCTQSLIENRSNFNRSGAPTRFMYYEDGSWVNFSNEALDSIRSGFMEGKPMVDVQIGRSRFIFDFYRMVQIDFETGNQRSIAWIDVDGKCFFPKSFIGPGGEFGDVFGNANMEMVCVPENQKIETANATDNLSSEHPKIEIEIIIGENWNSNKRKPESVESQYKEEEETEGSSSNDQRRGSKKRQLVVSDLESPRWPKAKLLKEAEKAYSVVKNLFLTAFGVAEPGAFITGIHQCMRTGPLDRARYEVFQKQMEITEAARGEPNMTFAWHGTSAKEVATILTHGFGMPSNFSSREGHGVGIFLSPVRSSPTSVMLSEVEEDDNGEKHVILCRVILGKCEKVEEGSQQLYPSSVDFDTGVDDVENPNWYVVWCANMNSHILPECVVSYKSSYRMPGHWNGLPLLKGVPNSSNLLTAKLFSKLGDSLPSSKAREFQTLCGTYKDGKVGKDTFMKCLRSMVGDDMLRSTIREIRGCE